jgi:hypothetical protein
METWHEVEYSYVRPGSEKIKYKGLKVFKNREEAEKFAAVVYWLSRKEKSDYDSRQLTVSKEYLGEGKFVALKKIYRCTKKEITLRNK